MGRLFSGWSRRKFALLSAAAAITGGLGAPPVLGRARQRVVVIGGGPGGVSAAARLAALYPRLEITLVEAGRTYLTPFFGNRYLGGLMPIDALIFDYQHLARQGRIRVVEETVVTIEPEKRNLRLSGGGALNYDRLILAPGVGVSAPGIEGYDAAAQSQMPHAYLGTATDQWRQLKARIDAMAPGGVFALSVPGRPYRCHPAPYERVSLVAGYLKRKNPRAKVLVLDANNSFPLMEIMQAHWEEHFGDMIEWVPGDFGGKVIAVDAKSGRLITGDEAFTPEVANVIPPQRAHGFAVKSGLTDDSGWCPVDPETFASRLIPDVHVVGDAIDPGDMPRSAFAANSQAKACAVAVGNALTGGDAPSPQLRNACYFLLKERQGLIVGGAYTARDGRITGTEGHSSAIDEPPETRAAIAEQAERWYQEITKEMFG